MAEPSPGPIKPVIIALDGELAVEVLDADGPHKVPNRTAEAIYFTLQREPNGDTARVGVLFSDLFELTDPRSLGLTGDITLWPFDLVDAEYFLSPGQIQALGVRVGIDPPLLNGIRSLCPAHRSSSWP